MKSNYYSVGSCETGISHVHGGQMYISSSEAQVIAHILKIAEEHPDDVHILKRPEENDGCVYARMPFGFLKIKPPKHMNLSEEERRIRSERLRQHRFQKTDPKSAES